MRARYRSVFLSDIHLGSVGCRAHALLRLLRRLACDILDSVGGVDCGDWVESCTLLVEHEDGAMRWVDGLALLHHLETAVVDGPPRPRAGS